MTYLLVDGKVGLTKLDEEFANKLTDYQVNYCVGLIFYCNFKLNHDIYSKFLNIRENLIFANIHKFVVSQNLSAC